MNSNEESSQTSDQERTSLAYHRNRWAAERTLMAWIRTSIALVTFGFAFDKFFAFLHRDGEAPALDASYSWFGMVLIASGIVLLLLAVAEHLIILGRLSRREPLMTSSFSLPLIGAMVVLLIGIGALLLLLTSTP